jgi:hypothetical protein
MMFKSDSIEGASRLEARSNCHIAHSSPRADAEYSTTDSATGIHHGPKEIAGRGSRASNVQSPLTGGEHLTKSWGNS